MLALLKRLHKEESGQDLIEYALLAGLISVSAISLFPALVTAIEGAFTKITTALAGSGS